MFARLRAAAWASAVIATAPPAHAQLPTITDYTKSFEKRDGYFPLYWDGAKGRLLVEIPAGRLGEDFLFLPSLATGLGDVQSGGRPRATPRAENRPRPGRGAPGRGRGHHPTLPRAHPHPDAGPPR